MKKKLLLLLLLALPGISQAVNAPTGLSNGLIRPDGSLIVYWTQDTVPTEWYIYLNGTLTYAPYRSQTVLTGSQLSFQMPNFPVGTAISLTMTAIATGPVYSASSSPLIINSTITQILYVQNPPGIPILVSGTTGGGGGGSESVSITAWPNAYLGVSVVSKADTSFTGVTIEAGTVSILQASPWTVSGSASITQGGPLTVSGSASVTQGGPWTISGSAGVTQSGPWTVSGSASVTQGGPFTVSGSVGVSSLPAAYQGVSVVAAVNQNVVQASPWTVSGSASVTQGGPFTISGSASVTQGGPFNVSVLATTDYKSVSIGAWSAGYLGISVTAWPNAYNGVSVVSNVWPTPYGGVSITAWPNAYNGVTITGWPNAYAGTSATVINTSGAPVFTTYTSATISTTPVMWNEAPVRYVYGAETNTAKGATIVVFEHPRYGDYLTTSLGVTCATATFGTGYYYLTMSAHTKTMISYPSSNTSTAYVYFSNSTVLPANARTLGISVNPGDKFFKEDTPFTYIWSWNPNGTAIQPLEIIHEYGVPIPGLTYY